MDEHTVNECKYKNGFEAGYKQGYEEGKRVCSAEAVWIPVTDSLPKTDGRFMVTIKNRGKYRTEMRNFDYRTQTWESARYISENIVAWQQRPKPYCPNAKQEV